MPFNFRNNYVYCKVYNDYVYCIVYNDISRRFIILWQYLVYAEGVKIVNDTRSTLYLRIFTTHKNIGHQL